MISVKRFPDRKKITRNSDPVIHTTAKFVPRNPNKNQRHLFTYISVQQLTIMLLRLKYYWNTLAKRMQFVCDNLSQRVRRMDGWILGWGPTPPHRQRTRILQLYISFTSCHFMSHTFLLSSVKHPEILLVTEFIILYLLS